MCSYVLYRTRQNAECVAANSRFELFAPFEDVRACACVQASVKSEWGGDGGTAVLPFARGMNDGLHLQ